MLLFNKDTLITPYTKIVNYVALTKEVVFCVFILSTKSIGTVFNYILF